MVLVLDHDLLLYLELDMSFLLGLELIIFLFSVENHSNVALIYSVGY